MSLDMLRHQILFGKHVAVMEDQNIASGIADRLIPEKDLVAKHIKAHENRDDLVVCGMFWKRIYSFYYDRFEKEHKEKLAELYEDLHTVRRVSLYALFQNGHNKSCKSASRTYRIRLNRPGSHEP